MNSVNEGKGMQKRGVLLHRNGVTYFTKRTERTFFFILTLIMLVWGVLVKLNIL